MIASVRREDAAEVANAIVPDQVRPPNRETTTTNWRIVVLASVLLIALAVAILSVRYTGPEAPRWILVGAVENKTEDPRLSDALQLAFEQELLQSPQLSLVPRERVDDTLRLMRRATSTLDAATAREVAIRDGGIQLVTDAKVEQIGSTYVLSISVHDVHTKQIVLRAAVQARTADGLLDAVSTLSARIRAAVGERALHSSQGRRLARVSTSSLEALCAYSAGLDFVNEQNWAAAELRLRDAVALDLGFATAYVMLAHAVRNQRRPRAEWGPLFERANMLAQALPPRERYFVSGSFHQVNNAHEKAAAAYEAVLREFPNDFWAVNNLQAVYVRLRRNNDAARLAELRARVRPNDFVIAAQAAERFLLNTGNVSHGRSLVSRAAVVEPEELRTRPERLYSAWVRHFATFDSWLANDVDKAAALVTTLPAGRGNDDESLEATGLLWLALGRVAEAEKAFGRMSLDSLRYELLAYAALARGDQQTARRVLREGVALFDAKAPPPGAGSRAREILILETLVRSGLIREAEAYVRRLDTESEPELFAGELAAARGDLQSARRLLQAALRQTNPYTPSLFMVINTLADVYAQEDDWQSVASLLEAYRNTRVKAFTTGGSRGFEWLRSRARAARALRKLGDDTEAAAVEAELRQLLRLAAPDLVLVP